MILCIEDDPNLLYLLRIFMEELNEEVVAVESGEEALQVLALRRPKLIVTDHMLPGIKGLDLLRQIDKSIPAIVFSCIGDEEWTEEFKDREVVFVSKGGDKPFDDLIIAASLSLKSFSQT
jgi:CheY-like chemotaxis protein